MVLKETCEKYRWQIVTAAHITSDFVFRILQHSNTNTCVFLRRTLSSSIDLQNIKDRARAFSVKVAWKVGVVREESIELGDRFN